MTALAIASQKGGVGKTTVCINLAHALARRGWQTLVIDTDPQGGVGLSLSRTTRQKRGFHDFVMNGGDVRPFILPTRLPEFSILPTGQTEEFYALAQPPEWIPSRVKELLQQLDLLRYDCVIFDTAAGLSGMTEIIVRQSDFVMVPQQSEPLAVRSLPLMLENLARFRKDGSTVRVAGILLTMLQSNHEASIKVAAELRQMLPPQLLLSQSIPRDQMFLEASALGLPLALLRRNPPPVALLFDQLAADLEERIGLVQQKEQNQPHANLLD